MGERENVGVERVAHAADELASFGEVSSSLGLKIFVTFGEPFPPLLLRGSECSGSGIGQS